MAVTGTARIVCVIVHELLLQHTLGQCNATMSIHNVYESSTHCLTLPKMHPFTTFTRCKEGHLPSHVATLKSFLCNAISTLEAHASQGKICADHAQSVESDVAPKVLRMMTVRFELTPFRNSALSYRLRPLGHVIDQNCKTTIFRTYVRCQKD